MRMIFLSHILDANTPTYGNRNKISIEKKSDMSKGDIANDSYIATTVHIGTHIDMPYHFYEGGQTIEDFEIDFWRFQKVLFLDISPKSMILKNEIIENLETVEDIGYEILIVKTGICHKRDTEDFWKVNYGFDPEIYDYLLSNFPDIRVFGFDSISVSSFQNRTLGREAHKRFLSPEKPILLLEDMDLRNIDESTNFEEVIISPLRIANCDGLPCTVFGVLDD
jgi:kynurenine formamidase